MSNNLEDTLKELFALERKGINPGLERTISLLNVLNNPQNSFPTIHIAGTNGKGSVASIIASVLQEAGYSVGLYTSPHIYKFNERISINSVNIPDIDLAELAESLIAAGKPFDATFFELTTALAFEYFARKHVDIAVIETGLGGRFDSTNVITPILSVITSIDIDHTEYLGSTLSDIAREKGGIIKPNVPVVLGELKSKPLFVLIDIALSTDAECYLTDTFNVELVRYLPEHKAEILVDSDLHRFDSLLTPLVGDHQLANHLVAINSLRHIRKRFPFTNDDVVRGVANVKQNTNFIRRIELISSNPLTIIDVAHNPAALQCFTKTISSIYPDQLFNIIFGAMSDKDTSAMLLQLKPLAKQLILTQPNTPRSESSKNLADTARVLNFPDVIEINIPQDAYNYAKSLNEPLLIVGSFYLVCDIII